MSIAMSQTEKARRKTEKNFKRKRISQNCRATTKGKVYIMGNSKRKRNRERNRSHT